MHKRISYAAAAAGRATDVLAGDESASELLTEARNRIAEAHYRILMNACDVSTLGGVAISVGNKPEYTALAILNIRSALSEIQRCT